MYVVHAESEVRKEAETSRRREEMRKSGELAVQSNKRRESSNGRRKRSKGWRKARSAMKELMIESKPRVRTGSEPKKNKGRNRIVERG